MPTTTPNSNDVLSVLRHSQKILEDIIRERNEHSTTLATLRVKLDSLEGNVRDMLQVIQGGTDGGLRVKMQKIESDISSIEDELIRIKRSGEADTKGKYMLAAAVVSGFVGLIAALVNVVIR